MDTQRQLNMNSSDNNNNTRELVDEEEDIPLPGFRFHPLDEELVGFYLLRKVEKKPLSIELIKEIDIYKYDPWDLPKGNTSGEKEWYFFCRRGRKYRNSIRPNRVTGSGFWKATGIDRPIYSSDGTVCIGLKKSLVYYRGSAGKGTKTEWMMHEFRLPPHQDNQNSTQIEDKSLQDAEVWTLCRILKRSPSYKKTLPEWKEVSARKSQPVVETSSGDSDYDMQSYISFQTPQINEKKPFVHNHHHQHQHQHQFYHETNHLIIHQGQLATTSTLTSDLPQSTTASCSSFSGLDVNEFGKNGECWDDLRSAVDQFSVGDPFFFM